MKIKNTEEAKVQVISRTEKKAEVIVSQPGPNKTIARDTRHLLCKNGVWTDTFGNKYEA